MFSVDHVRFVDPEKVLIKVYDMSVSEGAASYFPNNASPNKTKICSKSRYALLSFAV